MSSEPKPMVAPCLPVCEAKIPSYTSASSVPSHVSSSESITTYHGSSSEPSVHCCASNSFDAGTRDLSKKHDSFPLYFDSFSPVNIKSYSNEEPILSNFYTCSITVKGCRRQFKSLSMLISFVVQSFLVRRS